MDFNRNNLDLSTSPYLRQHSANPVHWQEWSDDFLQYASEQNKPILVSIGYSTCHWCHVMAAEAFSDPEIAAFLNEHFVSIKVDREQRPDIDQYMMDFLVNKVGHGGWPLNVFLTPDRRPFFGVTYAPVEPIHGMPAFMEILKSLLDFHQNHADSVTDYTPGLPNPLSVPEDELLKIVHSMFDGPNGGYGIGQKFPQVSTLLFNLHWFDYSKNPIARDLAEIHLDAMMRRGLHDHLQGGFFRYCTDRAWTIPHFEKMLYDQALLLWAYSAGYKALGKSEYKAVADKIIQCLDETFEDDGLYYSAHDADTDYVEGSTYIWSRDEIKELLDKEEFDEFKVVYDITDSGNFEGKNHLIKIKDRFLPGIERKLLDTRNKRPQPFTDRKILTGWNALTGIALLMAWRYTGNRDALDKSIRTFDRLIDTHYRDGSLFHASLNGAVQEDEFLEDHASMLLYATFLHEETGEYFEIMEDLYSGMMNFLDDVWYEARNIDFRPVAARGYDQPTPSSIALAELADLRMRILLGREYSQMDYKSPGSNDFANVAALVANGKFHLIHVPANPGWDRLPLNTVHVKSDHIQDCHEMLCKKYDSIDKLLTGVED